MKPSAQPASSGFSWAPRRPSRRGSRGSTIIEVLMAISVLAIGASGIFALQKATVVANRDAKNLEVANHIASSWLDRLRSDGMKWNYPSPGNALQDLDTDTQWLRQIDQQANAWYRPTDGTTIYGVHDPFGNDDPSGSLTGPYCVNLRLAWVGSDHNLIRAEVRVYWLRQGIQNFGSQLSITPPNPLCGANAAAPPDVDASTDVFHVVHAVTGIFKNMPR